MFGREWKFGRKLLCTEKFLEECFFGENGIGRLSRTFLGCEFTWFDVDNASYSLVKIEVLVNAVVDAECRCTDLNGR